MLMTQVLQANIFFFITAVTVVILAVIIAVALVYIIRILRDLKAVSTIMRTQAHLVSEDVNELRRKLKEKEWRWTDAFAPLSALWNSRKKGRNGKKK